MTNPLAKLLAAAMAVFLACTALADEAPNLLQNADLKQVADGLPVGWSAAGANASFSAEREFRLKRGTADGSQTFRYEAAADTLKGVPAGASLCFSARVTAHSNPSTHFTLEAAFLKDGAEVARHAIEPQTIYVGWETVAFYFPTPQAAYDQIALEVKLLDTGRLTFMSPSLRQEEKPQETLEWMIDAYNYARVKDFPIRNTYFAGQEPTALTLECFLPTDTLKITLKEIGGEVIKEETWTELPARSVFERAFALPALKEGAYELALESGRVTDNELFRIRGPQTKGVTFDENRWMILDGKPFFPIALNHIPTDDADFFRVCRDSGINTLGFYYLFAENDFIFDRIRKGMVENDLASFHWNTFAFDMGRPADDITRDFDDFAAKVATLPKFIGFLDDETMAHSQGDYAGAFKSCARFFKAFPDYVLWENHCPRVHRDVRKTVLGHPVGPTRYFPLVRRYSAGMDVLSIDIYPVPAPHHGGNDLPNRSLSCVGDYTEIVDALGWNRKPVWMILQAYGVGEYATVNDLVKFPRPTYRELRFMAYDVILHGATGIDWHSEAGKGHGPCDETDSEWWRDFAFVNLELAQVGGKLAGSVPQGKPVVDGCIRSWSWRNGGESVVIALNESPSETGSFTTPEGDALYLAPEATPVAGGTRLELKPYDVVILTTTPVAVSRPPIYEHRANPNPPLWEKGKFVVPGNWVLVGNRTQGSEFLRVKCDLPEVPKGARLRIVGSGASWLTINGQQVGRVGDFFLCFDFDADPFLKQGENEIVVELVWRGGRDKACALCLIDADGNVLAKTDKQTEWSPNGKDGWQPAVDGGPHGPDNPNKQARGAGYLIRQ